LDARTQLLYDERHLFINGEAVVWPSGESAMKKLANERLLTAGELRGSAPISLLYRWYCHGFVHLA
jgi:50S ribosomal protein L16 3-hydroxylase